MKPVKEGFPFETTAFYPAKVFGITEIPRPTFYIKKRTSLPDRFYHDIDKKLIGSCFSLFEETISL